MSGLKMDHILNAGRSNKERTSRGKMDMLILDANTEPETAVAALAKYFNENEKRDVIGLRVGDKDEGFLEKKHVRELYSKGNTTRGNVKGIGGADPASLPGGGPDNLEFIKYKCPENGCDQTCIVLIVDPENKPECPDHKKEMEMIK